MIAIHQTIFQAPGRTDGHDAEGRPGNCVQAAIASITDTPLDEVPHFAEMPGSWWNNIRRWCRSQGYDMVCLGSSLDPQGFADWPQHALVSGPSPRGSFWHICVCDSEGQIIHDPHPSGAGLDGTEREYWMVCEPYDNGWADE